MSRDEVGHRRALAMPGVLAVLGGVTTIPFGTTENAELALFQSSEIKINPALPADTGYGDADGGLAAAAARVSVTYTTPVQHNNPMEPHAPSPPGTTPAA